MTIEQFCILVFFVLMLYLFWLAMWKAIEGIDKDVEQRVEADLVNSEEELNKVDDDWCDDCRSYSHRRDCPSYKVPQDAA